MVRTLLAALLATASVAGVAHAQYAPSRPMPEYDDGQQAPPADDGGYEDSYSSSDARDEAPPPPGQYRQAPDYRSDPRDQPGYTDTPPPAAQRWTTPPPYARDDQVEDGRADDDNHRADRDYTASLNHRRWPGRNAAPAPGNYGGSSADYRAALADHDREMQEYRTAQARYADRIARWRQRADACEAGNTDACQGPDR